MFNAQEQTSCFNFITSILNSSSRNGSYGIVEISKNVIMSVQLSQAIRDKTLENMVGPDVTRAVYDAMAVASEKPPSLLTRIQQFITLDSKARNNLDDRKQNIVSNLNKTFEDAHSALFYAQREKEEGEFKEFNPTAAASAPASRGRVVELVDMYSKAQNSNAIKEFAKDETKKVTVAASETVENNTVNRPKR